jgi:hypothetical protein
MKSPDAGITMTFGAAVGTLLGVMNGNISMSMAIGAGIGAIIGGLFMLINKLNKQISRNK